MPMDIVLFNTSFVLFVWRYMYFTLLPVLNNTVLQNIFKADLGGQSKREAASLFIAMQTSY